jgi:hypothetical protein
MPVAAERNIEVVAEPARQRHMPAPLSDRQNEKGRRYAALCFSKAIFPGKTIGYLVFKRPKGQLQLQNGLAVVRGQLRKMTVEQPTQ